MKGGDGVPHEGLHPLGCRGEGGLSNESITDGEGGGAQLALRGDGGG